MRKKSKRDQLLPFNEVIQICPECGEIDVYKNDGHYCSKDYQESKADTQECGDQ